MACIEYAIQDFLFIIIFFGIFYLVIKKYRVYQCVPTTSSLAVF